MVASPAVLTKMYDENIAGGNAFAKGTRTRMRHFLAPVCFRPWNHTTCILQYILYSVQHTAACSFAGSGGITACCYEYGREGPPPPNMNATLAGLLLASRPLFLDVYLSYFIHHVNHVHVIFTVNRWTSSMMLGFTETKF